jgi:hypothetical protein
MGCELPDISFYASDISAYASSYSLQAESFEMTAEIRNCVVIVSQYEEHKIAGKWFEVPQSIGSLHAPFLQLAPSRFPDSDRAAYAGTARS